MDSSTDPEIGSEEEYEKVERSKVEVKLEADSCHEDLETEVHAKLEHYIDHQVHGNEDDGNERVDVISLDNDKSVTLTNIDRGEMYMDLNDDVFRSYMTQQSATDQDGEEVFTHYMQQSADANISKLNDTECSEEVYKFEGSDSDWSGSEEMSLSSSESSEEDELKSDLTALRPRKLRSASWKATSEVSTKTNSLIPRKRRSESKECREQRRKRHQNTPNQPRFVKLMRIGIDNKIISEEVKDVTNVSEMRKLMSVPGRTDGKERGGAYAWKPGRIILNRNQQKKPIGKESSTSHIFLKPAGVRSMCSSSVQTDMEDSSMALHSTGVKRSVTNHGNVTLKMQKGRNSALQSKQQNITFSLDTSLSPRIEVKKEPLTNDKCRTKTLQTVSGEKSTACHDDESKEQSPKLKLLNYQVYKSSSSGLKLLKIYLPRQQQETSGGSQAHKRIADGSRLSQKLAVQSQTPTVSMSVGKNEEHSDESISLVSGESGKAAEDNNSTDRSEDKDKSIIPVFEGEKPTVCLNLASAVTAGDHRHGLTETAETGDQQAISMVKSDSVDRVHPNELTLQKSTEGNVVNELCPSVSVGKKARTCTAQAPASHQQQQVVQEMDRGDEHEMNTSVKGVTSVDRVKLKELVAGSKRLPDATEIQEATIGKVAKVEMPSSADLKSATTCVPLSSGSRQHREDACTMNKDPNWTKLVEPVLAADGVELKKVTASKILPAAPQPRKAIVGKLVKLDKPIQKSEKQIKYGILSSAPAGSQYRKFAHKTDSGDEPVVSVDRLKLNEVAAQKLQPGPPELQKGTVNKVIKLNQPFQVGAMQTMRVKLSSNGSQTREIKHQIHNGDQQLNQGTGSKLTTELQKGNYKIVKIDKSIVQGEKQNACVNYKLSSDGSQTREFTDRMNKGDHKLNQVTARERSYKIANVDKSIVEGVQQTTCAQLSSTGSQHRVCTTLAPVNKIAKLVASREKLKEITESKSTKNVSQFRESTTTAGETLNVGKLNTSKQKPTTGLQFSSGKTGQVGNLITSKHKLATGLELSTGKMGEVGMVITEKQKPTGLELSSGRTGKGGKLITGKQKPTPCLGLSPVGDQEQTTVASKLAHNTQQLYVCLTCGQKCDVHANLLNHLNTTKHGLQCPVCFERLPDVVEMWEHCKRIHNHLSISDIVSDSTSTDGACTFDIDGSVVRGYMPGSAESSSVEGKSNLGLSSLDHRTNKHDRLYSCETCHKRFSKYGNLFNHMNTKKHGVRCPVCLGYLPNALEMLQHCIAVHKNSNIREKVSVNASRKVVCSADIDDTRTTGSNTTSSNNSETDVYEFERNDDPEKELSAGNSIVCPLCSKYFESRLEYRDHCREHYQFQPRSKRPSREVEVAAIW